MQLDVNKKKLQEICRKNNIVYLGLFGSTARGDETPNSDIDLLVEFSKTKSLFELVDIQTTLEQVFPRQVDMVLRDSIKKRLEPYILKDLVPLYDKK